MSLASARLNGTSSKEKAMVVYKPKKISEERIQQLVADAGHDTDLYTATDEAYNGWRRVVFIVQVVKGVRTVRSIPEPRRRPSLMPEWCSSPLPSFLLRLRCCGR